MLAGYTDKLANLRGNTKTKYWIVFWTVIFTVSFYYSTTPEIFTPLDKNLYSHSSKGVDKANKWSTVRQDGAGFFFMHPGEKQPVELHLKSLEGGGVRVDLSIRKGSKHGDILFSTFLNDKLVNESVVITEQGTTSFKLKVKKGDILKIVADKHGVTSSDWGDVKLYKFNKKALYLIISALLIWLFALYLTYSRNQAAHTVASYFVFLTFCFAEKTTFGSITANAILGYTAFLVPLALLLSFLFNLGMFIRLPRWLAIGSGYILFLLIISPLIFISYKISFDTPIAKEALFAIYQSNTLEGVEFVSDFISFTAISLFLAALAAILVILWWHQRSQIKKPDSIAWLALILTLGIIASSHTKELKVPHLIKTTFKEYRAELKQFRNLQNKRTVQGNKLKATKEEQGETYVVIIGESQNKQHMQLYGYPRDTTPKLQKLFDAGELIRFNQAYSNHTHTMPVLSLALTEAAQDKKKNYYDSASIVEIFNAAKFQTTWLSNQNLLGAWDNLVAIIANQSDKVIGINNSIGKTTKSQRQDGDLIPYLEKELNIKTKKNRVLFVHLMGNHGSYCSRFEKEYKLFNRGLDISLFGTNLSQDTKRHSAINCYDNSIAYNDFVVSALIEQVEKTKSVSAVIYMADHADDVIAGLGHNSAKFTYSMTQIPMFAWLSKEYRDRYPETSIQLENSVDTLFSNDRLYDTLLGLTNIKTDLYRNEFDLTKNTYRLTNQEAITLHGKQSYIAKDNHYYWQKKNTQILKDKALTDKFFPHRINSTGKLNDVWQLGFRSFEVDMVFDYNKDGKFIVGHNHGVMGMELEKFLRTIDYQKINRMWFDFKNLNGHNLDAAKAELERLHKIFNLKDKVMLESGWTGDEFKQLSKEGWHTSYYLPTGRIVNLLKEKNTNELKNLAEKIAKQVQQQETAAVSFDTRLYPFVKEYLESLLPKEKVYHAWYGPALHAANFEEQLNSKAIYQDKRIKTFLIPIKTAFNL